MKPFIDLDAVEIPEDISFADDQGDAPETAAVTDELLKELGLDQPKPLQAIPPAHGDPKGIPKQSSKRKGKAIATSPPRTTKRPTPAIPRRSLRSQSVPPQISIPIPSFLEVSDGEALKFLDCLTTDADRLLLKDKPLTGLCDALASHLLASSSILESIAHREDPARLRTIANEQSKKIRLLKSQLSDAQNPQTDPMIVEGLRNQTAALEKDLQEKDKLLAEAQKEKIMLQEEIARRERTAYQLGKDKGLEDFRHLLLKSGKWQTFLDHSRHSLLAAYLKSKEYFEKMRLPCGAYFKIGFQYALKQAQEQGFAGTLGSPSNVNLSPSLLKWEGNLEEDVSYPWWQAVDASMADFLTSMEVKEITDISTAPPSEEQHPDTGPSTS